MESINDLIIAIQVIIPLCGILRIIDCYIQMSLKPDEATSMKNKIKNVIGFIVLSACVLSTIQLIAGYYTLN